MSTVGNDKLKNSKNKGSVIINSKKLELKPPTHKTNKEDMSNLNLNKKMEKLRRKVTPNIDKQIYIIGENIVFTMKSLPEFKYKALIDRILVWGMYSAIEVFIMQYYLIIKKDVNIRQFIIINIEKIIRTVITIIEANSIVNLYFQDVTNNIEDNVQILKNNKKVREETLLSIKPSDMLDSITNKVNLTEYYNNDEELEEENKDEIKIIDVEDGILDLINQRNEIRKEIILKLKKDNLDLEEL